MFLWTWDARPYPYFPDLLSVWADGNVWITGHWVTGKLGLSSLAAIVRRLCLKAGLADSDFDVSQLTGQVEGYVVTRQTTIRSLIEELMSAYFFDALESSSSLKFIPRGGSTILTNDKSSLIREDGQETLSIIRRQELELPRDINIIYINRLNQYQAGTQIATREYADTQDVDTLSLPIVMTDQEAKAIADRSLYLRWMERTQYRFYLGMGHAHLEPTDVISITEDDIMHTMRITRMLADRGRIRVDAVAEDVTIYETNAVAGNTPGLITATDPVSVTRLELLDLPALPSDNAEDAYLRYGVTGEGRGWRGAVLYRSDDAGANYAVMDALDVPAVIGTAITSIGSFSEGNCFDHTNSLIVSLIGNGELQSVTELAVLNGANAAILGDEIIQFTTAVELAPGKYQLSHFLRGRLGTEWAVNSHVAGEKFVLLDGRLGKEKMPLSGFGISKLYKPVTIGGTLGSAASQSFTYIGRSFKPYAPVHVAGSRDGSGNLTISWVRRTRLGGEWRDGVDILLAETAEKYEIDILSGSAVLRTLTAVSSDVTYSLANQVTDFGSGQSSVSVKIYQISEMVGRGYAALANV
ncbi:MAG: phage tail protein [Rickettsiales bacterium]